MSATVASPITRERAAARSIGTAAMFCGDETTTGTIVATSRGAGADWADAVVASCARGDRVIAALPFTPGAMGIAHRLRLDRDTPVSQAATVAEVSRVHSVVPAPAPEVYAARVSAALDEIADGRIEKVVLGRELHVTSEPPLDPDALVARLREQRPGRYVFGVPLEQPAPGVQVPVLLGASPELLIRRTGSAVSSFPLAGSIPRVEDPEEDRRRADALLTSAKDLREHAFVVEAIVRALEPLCAAVTADERPRLVSTDKLHHLGTRIDAILRPGAEHASALHLAQLLHPTPAVGGTPRTAALDFIDRVEGDRGPLTGTTGWVDHRGDGEFAVTIRAGVLDGAQLRLYAGAGIVAGSDPQSEVRETGAKLATMCSAVGV